MSSPPEFERQLERTGEVGTLLLVRPEHLDRRHPERLGLDRESDLLLTVECRADFETPPSHKQRAALLLASLRSHAAALEEDGWRVLEHRLTDPFGATSAAEALEHAASRLAPDRLVALRPPGWRDLEALEALSLESQLEIAEDPHFVTTPEAFAEWADGRKRYTMEHFYRALRRRESILVDADGEPEGGEWNYDSENREPLGDEAPEIPARLEHEPTEIAATALDVVATELSDLPGELAGFAWPTTREQALAELDDFVRRRLPHFGRYQDAMESDEPWLFHSRLSAALNLELLDPRELIGAAVEAFEVGDAPIASVEGFVRQILGWREFIRGIYWHQGPSYADENALEHDGNLPDFYWTADTEMHCVAQSVGQVLEHGYGHHIQRLMVTGNLALTAGIEPRRVDDWYRGMFVDAFDWVTTPNVVGMTLYADGGVVGTKPYAASGKYIDRMSDYCARCRFDPGERTGEYACPFTTLYWDFLRRHRERLQANPRARLGLRNLDRIAADELEAIARRARELRQTWGVIES
ncbi:MAG: cryptochrome/photolyase family protein [Thermoanaerobaculia bacterium]|nr:cryptochrome/photolyase family protein [Thermoanaerobaculia bacterium]